MPLFQDMSIARFRFQNLILLKKIVGMYDLCPHSTVSAKLYFFGKTTLITYLSFEEVQLHLRTEAIHKSVQNTAPRVPS